MEDSAAAGVSGKVTVKDEIVYEKVDVSDEVKKESEINAAKEDTEIQTQVESVLTDTVEWVESTCTPLDGGGWEEVSREEIPARIRVEPFRESWKTSAYRDVFPVVVDRPVIRPFGP